LKCVILRVVGAVGPHAIALSQQKLGYLQQLFPVNNAKHEDFQRKLKVWNVEWLLFRSREAL